MWNNMNSSKEIAATNARLLNAAPELLAACKFAEECTVVGGIKGMSVDEAAIKVRGMLHKAIAKAEPN